MRVVYATDFSDHSNRVLNVLMRYKNLISEVVIVRVINVHRLSFPFVNVKEAIENEMRFAQEKILEITEFLDDYGIKSERFYIPVGDPAEEIVRIAEDENADLILMGRRGRSLKKILLGSVAENVSRMSKVPVLVVKDGIDVFKRILYVHYPLDSEIPKILYSLGRVSEKVYVTHVVEPMLPPESTKHIFDGMLEKTKGIIENLQKELESKGINSEGLVGIGYPGREILEIAKNCKATCIILKTPKFSKVTDCVLRYSKQSVMVVKA